MLTPSQIKEVVTLCDCGRIDQAAEIWRQYVTDASDHWSLYDQLISALTTDQFQAILAGMSPAEFTKIVQPMITDHNFLEAERLLRAFVAGREAQYPQLTGRLFFCVYMSRGRSALMEEREATMEREGRDRWIKYARFMPAYFLPVEDVTAIIEDTRRAANTSPLLKYLKSCLFYPNEEIDQLLVEQSLEEKELISRVVVGMAEARVADYAVLRSAGGRAEHDQKLRANSESFSQFVRHEREKLRGDERYVVFDRAMDAIDLLEGRAQSSWPNSAACYWDALQFARFLRQRIDNALPTAMIRLGDGEGRYLAYPNDFAEFQKADRLETEGIWWGDYHLSDEQVEQASRRLCTAIGEADIVGIAPFYRCVHSIDATVWASTPNQRGLIAVLDWLCDTRNFDTTKKTLVSAHVHTDLFFWDLFDLILCDLDEVTIVSCHDAEDALKRRFGIRSVRNYRIPPEHKYRGMLPDTLSETVFPGCYDRVREKIAAAPPGPVLIAAGFIGKLIAKDVRDHGGVAIDIGSVPDYWSGNATRMQSLSVFGREARPTTEQ